MMKLSKVCVITGGTSGIGLATAIRFAASGWRVAICGRDEARLEIAARSIAEVASKETKEKSVLAIRADVALSANCQALVAQAAEQFGRVDVLVNNAGVAPLAPITDLTVADFESVTAINQWAVLAMTQAVWPIMQVQNGGLIINISSMAAVNPFPGFSLYGASKAWVELFTKATSDEGSSHGIDALALRLGAVETPLLRGLFPDFPREQALSPSEVGEFVVDLAVNPMRYESGSAIPFQQV